MAPRRSVGSVWLSTIRRRKQQVRRMDSQEPPASNPARGRPRRSGSAGPAAGAAVTTSPYESPLARPSPAQGRSAASQEGKGLAPEWGNRSRSSCVEGSARRLILMEMHGTQGLLELSAKLRMRGNGIGGDLPRRSAPEQQQTQSHGKPNTPEYPAFDRRQKTRGKRILNFAGPTTYAGLCGSSKIASIPPSRRFCNVNRPPAARAMSRAIPRPRPVPPV